MHCKSPRLNVALLALALTSCGDNAERPSWGTNFAGAPNKPAPEPFPPLIDGTWGMFTENTDHIGVSLDMHQRSLTGFGCFSGFPNDKSEPSFVADTCGEIIRGSIDGTQVQFEFEVSSLGGIRYWNDVFAARDASRMAGHASYSYLSDSPPPTLAVWLPMEPDQGWLSSDLEWPDSIAWQNDGARGYDLTLDDPASGSDFTADQKYRIDRYRNGLVGDLGAFWASELTFSVDPQGELVLSAGPVAETAPWLPVHLELSFAAGQVVRAQARMPSGATYFFSAAPHVAK